MIRTRSQNKKDERFLTDEDISFSHHHLSHDESTHTTRRSYINTAGVVQVGYLLKKKIVDVK